MATRTHKHPKYVLIWSKPTSKVSIARDSKEVDRILRTKVKPGDVLHQYELKVRDVIVGTSQ